MGERDTINDFNIAYQQAVDKWQVWWKEAERDLEFKLGNQWSGADRAKLRAQQRDAHVFGQVKRIVNTLSGYEMNNRQALKIEPVSGNKKTASQLSACLMWQMQFADGYRVMSKAFEAGPLTTGLNLVEIYLDFSYDPVNGDIRYMRVPFNQMLLDPFFTELDGSDIDYMMRRRWLSKNQIKSLIPGKDRTIDAIRPKGPDQKFPKSPPNKDWLGKNLLKFDQFLRKDSKKVKFIVNGINGQTREWEGSTAELDQMLNSQSPFPDEGGMPQSWGALKFPGTDNLVLQVIPKRVETSKVAYIVEDKILYEGADPTKLDEFPFVPVLGYWDPEYSKMEWKLQGVVRAIRDPQTESNRRRLKALDIIDTQLIGMKAKASSVIDKNVLYQRGQGMTVWLEKDANMDDVGPIIGPPIPPGLFEMMQQMDKDQDQILGLSAEFTGLPEPGEGVQSFIHAKLRYAAGLTVHKPLLDTYQAANRQLGLKTMKMIQRNWTPEKIKRIIEEEPTPEFHSKSFGRYDCHPSEGVITDTQRQMRFGEALSLKAQFPDAPIAWSEIMEYSNLEIKPEKIQQLKQKEQMQSQIQMLQVQGTIEAQKMEIALNKAKAAAAESKSGLDRAKTMEVLKKIEHMGIPEMLKMMETALKIEQEGGFGLEPQGQIENVTPIRKQLSGPEGAITKR